MGRKKKKKKKRVRNQEDNINIFSFMKLHQVEKKSTMIINAYLFLLFHCGGGGKLIQIR